MILIAVALFGALSYTVANMMRSGSPDAIGEQQASILVDEILATSRQYRQAVQTLKISNGCEDEDISFEATGLAGYVHAPVATDDCKVFHSSGGGISYTAPSADLATAVDWVFSGAHAVSGVGSDCGNADCTELIVLLGGLNKKVCLSLNEKLGVTLTAGDGPSDAGAPGTAFTDTYTTGVQMGDEDANLTGQPAACFKDSDDNTYHFYQTLIAR